LKNICCLIFILLFTSNLHAEGNKSFSIYLNADMTGSKESGEAIEKGIRMALSEIDYTISGYKIIIKVKDHRGNSRRSLKYLEEFSADDTALITYSGLHSLPLISNLDYINKNALPVFSPWAAAGPITRSVDEFERNWVFRLSIDDIQAGEVITSYAIDTEKFKHPVLLLENTAWGKFNYKQISEALMKRGLKQPEVFWFSWGIKENGSRVIMNKILKTNSDVIFFVGNAPEGVVIFKTISEIKKENRLPIRSHWGITGGNFFERLGSEVINIDLKFLQTSFSFTNNYQSQLAIDVYNNLKLQYEEITEPKDLKAPVGFIHAYDLTKIFIEAFKSIEFTDDIQKNRNTLRESLENIERPVIGLVKTYNKPFSKYNINNIFAHEALNIDDFVMAKYLADGSIGVINEK
jgi:branched-chain amino acid transport system substrate-binding protein